jgi:hypothetical protein
MKFLCVWTSCQQPWNILEQLVVSQARFSDHAASRYDQAWPE